MNTHSAVEPYLPYKRAITNDGQIFEDTRNYSKDNLDPHRPSHVIAL